MVVDHGIATFPSIRATMGDWVYYVTTMRFADVVERVSRTNEIHTNTQLRDWIQRELTPRTGDICRYLLTQEQRFFNALILGVYGGTPEWFPVELVANKALLTSRFSARARESIGLLQLQGRERIFAIDGQHRVEAIKMAVSESKALEEEEISAILVAHKTDRAGLERTRRLFSTLNRYAKPVSKGEIVALDEDDAFALTTRRLAEEYEPLKGKRLHYGKRTQIPQSDHVAITTILALADIVATLSLPIKGSTKERQRLTKLRPAQTELDALYDGQVMFWEALRENVSDVKLATDADPAKCLAGKYRTAQGGHMLFRPAALKSFAVAVRALIDRGRHVRTAVTELAQIPFDIADPRWRGIFWDPIAAKILRPNPTLASSLLLHLIGEPPVKDGLDLQKEYRAALNDDSLKLPTPLQRAHHS